MDPGSLQSFELLDDGIHGEAVDRLVIEPVDHVAGADAEPVGGRALDGRDDRDLPVALADDDPEPVEGPALLLDHRGVLLGLEEVRVRVEGAEHPVDRRIDELVRRDVVRVPRARRGEDVGVFLEAGIRRVRDGTEPPAGDPSADRDGEKEGGDGEGAPDGAATGRNGGVVHVEGPSRTQ